MMYKKYCLILSPLLLCLVLVLFASFLSVYDASFVDLTKAKLAPSLQHFFGTDFLGRDNFIRCIKALQLSFFVGLSSSFLALVLGLFFGFIARLFWHNFFLALFDILLSLPSLLLAMFIQSLFKGGIFLMIIVLALSHFAFIAKLLYNELQNLEKSDFYLCAIVLGSSRSKALFFELLPACVNMLFVVFIFNIAHCISSEAALSFFGLGVPLAQPSLGNLLADGAKALFLGAWWLICFPVFLLLVLIMPLLALAHHLEVRFGVLLNAKN